MKTDIKSLLSVLVMIAVAFSSMGAMTAEIADTVSFDAKITMDAEQMLAVSGSDGTKTPDDTAETMKVAAEIIGALTLHGTATKDTAEFSVQAGDANILSFGIRNEDKGATFATSLLDSDVIFIPAEMIEQARQQIQAQQTASGNLDPQTLAEALQNIDREQIMKDYAETGEKLRQAIDAKKGETETGEFTVDGLTFTGKARVDITYTEFSELVLVSTKELASKGSLAPLFSLTGTDIATQIDQSIEELKNQPETDHPELFDLIIYTGEDNSAYYVCDMIGKAAEDGAAGETMHIAFGETDGQSRTKFVRVQDNDQMCITTTGPRNGAFDLHATTAGKSGDAEIDAGINEAGDLTLYAWIKGTNPDARIRINTESEGERTQYSLGLYADLNQMPLFRISGTAGKGGETVSVFEGESLTVIPAEKLANNEDSVADQLQLKLLAGVLRGITELNRNLPKDAASWINTQISEAMTPKTTQVEQPEAEPETESEPAAEGE